MDIQNLSYDELQNLKQEIALRMVALRNAEMKTAATKVVEAVNSYLKTYSQNITTDAQDSDGQSWYVIGATIEDNELIFHMC